MMKQFVKNRAGVLQIGGWATMVSGWLVPHIPFALTLYAIAIAMFACSMYGYSLRGRHEPAE